MNSPSIEVRRVDILDATAQQLIAALNAELLLAYPEPGATHFRLDPGEVATGQGAFFVAFEGDAPVGCGAVRRIEEDAAEIKRMYVVPEARGRGLSRAILHQLEAEARDIGALRIVLETGPKQLAAIALYKSDGFVDIPAYGEYVHSPATSRCMGKTL